MMAHLRDRTEPVDTARDRVRSSTDEDVLSALDQQIRRRVEQLKDDPRRIDDRLDELDCEWSIERALEVNASSLILIGLLGSRMGRRRGLLAVPLVVAGFLLQHGLQGWCPPLPILRRFGLRSRKEIDAEKFALKALRGDFEGVSAAGDTTRALRAVGR